MFAIEQIANFETPLRQLTYDLGAEGQMLLSFHPNCEVTFVNFRSRMATGDKKLVEVSQSEQRRPGFKLKGDEWELRGGKGETGSDADFFALYASGRHDLLSLGIRSGQELSPSFAATLMNAMKLAVSEALRQSLTEMGAMIIQGKNPNETRIILFETTPGSAGALKRVFEDTMVREIARNALELLHFDPEAGEHPSGTACVKACYDCLLGYHNQREHALLDRRAVEPFFRQLMVTEPDPVDTSGFEQLIESLHGSGAENEKYFLKCLQDRGYPLPEKHHFPLPADRGSIVLEVDYKVNGVNVFVDGSIHHEVWVSEMDDLKRSALKDEGIEYLVFRRGEEDAFFRKLRSFTG
jgi:hypothetical protein